MSLATRRQEMMDDKPNFVKRGADGRIAVWAHIDTGSGRAPGSAALLVLPIDEEDTDCSLVRPGIRGRARIILDAR